jgi:hypothetical protein
VEDVQNFVPIFGRIFTIWNLLSMRAKAKSILVFPKVLLHENTVDIPGHELVRIPPFPTFSIENPVYTGLELTLASRVEHGRPLLQQLIHLITLICTFGIN